MFARLFSMCTVVDRHCQVCILFTGADMLPVCRGYMTVM